MDHRQLMEDMARDIESTFGKLIASKTNHVPPETMEKIAVFVSKYDLNVRMILSEAFPPLSWDMSRPDATVNMEIAMECYGMARAVVRHYSRILRAHEQTTSQEVESPYEGVYLPIKPEPAGMPPFEPSNVYQEYFSPPGDKYTPFQQKWEYYRW